MNKKDGIEGMYDKDARKNKDIPNIIQTRFNDEDNRYLEGDGEKPVISHRSIDNPDHLGNPTKGDDQADQDKEYYTR